MIQGTSNVTKIKEAQIYGVVKTRLLQRKNAGSWVGNIRIYDMFSGDGVNIVDGQAVWGSPVETVNAIINSNVSLCKKVIFTASDIREDAVDRLKINLCDMNGFAINCKVADASSQIAEIAITLTKHLSDHAIVIIDPNGPGTLPYEEILNLSKHFSKRVDIFINISETAINRILGCRITTDKNWWAKYNTFSEIICKIFDNYKQAWIRQTIKGDRQKWRFICFWSYAKTVRGWEKQNLYSVTSKDELKLMLGKGANND